MTKSFRNAWKYEIIRKFVVFSVRSYLMKLISIFHWKKQISSIFYVYQKRLRWIGKCLKQSLLGIPFYVLNMKILWKTLHIHNLPRTGCLFLAAMHIYWSLWPGGAGDTSSTYWVTLNWSDLKKYGVSEILQFLLTGSKKRNFHPLKRNINFFFRSETGWLL